MLIQYNNFEDTWLGADRHVLLMPEYDGRLSPRPIMNKTRGVSQLHCQNMNHGCFVKKNTALSFWWSWRSSCALGTRLVEVYEKE